MKAHAARWWKHDDSGKVVCFLCPRFCHIAPGKTGFCQIRKNIDGSLIAESYGRPVALQVDPIEKKPLAEFLPGTYTFSLGTFGCNMGCVFCQNYHLSTGAYESDKQYRYLSAEEVISLAIQHKCKSIAFTYNEPTIFGEYVVDVAEKAHENGLQTVMVSNGYITQEAAKDIYPHIDAANIDMKGFTENFYVSMTKSHLQPVLESIKFLFSLGKHLEITNLVIPGKNDTVEAIDDFLDWVEANLDKSVPLHFSAFHPDYQYHDSPRTPAETLLAIRDRAVERGFTSIYLGNI